MQTSNISTCVFVSLLALLPSEHSSADVILIFEPSAGNTSIVDQTYGDNVSSAMENGFVYGDTDGTFAPNIAVDYATQMEISVTGTYPMGI